MSNPISTGFETRLDPATRRAIYDLRRRADEVFIGPDDPGTAYDLWFNTTDQILYVWWSDEWVALSVGTPGPEGPPGPAGPPGTSGGGTGTDEVWIGPSDPIAAHPTIELWVDTDDPGGGGGGTSGPLSYVHTQGTASDTWMIEHNLGWFPNATVIDSAGTTVEGDIVHLDGNTMTVVFSGAFTGTAYLS